MRLLVATKETQGQRKNDFCWVPEGEIVHFGFECDSETIDGHCGCKRAMVGISNNKATTTMKVEEVKNFSREQLLEELTNYYVRAWELSSVSALKIAEEEVGDLLDLVAQFPVGSVIEKRGDDFWVRRRDKK